MHRLFCVPSFGETVRTDELPIDCEMAAVAFSQPASHKTKVQIDDGRSIYDNFSPTAPTRIPIEYHGFKVRVREKEVGLASFVVGLDIFVCKGPAP